ncbi:ATP-binding protein [Marivirga tractuosa]|uniref:ATP-binding protein n=1 Tax=Marivirga tractuosa TaxID=1006 RepID=UPI0035CFD3EE
MKSSKGNRIYIIVSIIGILMLINIFLIRQNGQRITNNQKILNTTQEVIINAEEIVQTLHLLDVGIRGYAITGNQEMYHSPADSAEIRKEKAFKFLESTLRSQGYPLDEFKVLKDTVDFYFKYGKEIAEEIKLSNLLKAQALVAEDRGYPVWLLATRFSSKVESFENEIEAKANQSFQEAIQTSFWLQVILFLVTMPTLLYSAIYSIKSISLSNKLRKVESDKATILENQNETLDRLVRKRTDEILAQNEEIRAQNEEISSQNDIIMSHNEEMSIKQMLIEEKNEELTSQNEILNSAKATIEKQQKLLELRNEELIDEVAKQNENLKQTNLELVDQINKLEQFGYIVSHNLRAPTARLMGLGNLIDKTDSEEREKIVSLMIQSSKELHEVIDDMGRILLVQKPGSKILEEVDLEKSSEKVQKILKHEIERTETEIIENWGDEKIIKSLPLYIESILYNLISNAIKYHQKNKKPILKIRSYSKSEQIVIEIEDNGMGIDLERYGQKLFGLYKRFHFHVEGKGLGLYLVKSQIEALGGKIEVESQIGKGTKFKVYLHK